MLSLLNAYILMRLVSLRLSNKMCDNFYTIQVMNQWIEWNHSIHFVSLFNMNLKLHVINKLLVFVSTFRACNLYMYKLYLRKQERYCNFNLLKIPIWIRT